MKKFTLFLAVMLCFGVSMKAQTYVGEFNHNWSCIPGYFTSSGHPYAVRWVDHGEGVYDQYMSVYKSDFTTHLTDIYYHDEMFGDITGCEFIDIDANPFLGFGYKSENRVEFTQNVFNDDEFFEYFTEEYIITDTHYDTLYYHDGWYDENDMWHDTVYMYVDVWSDGYTTAYHVKSTNGSIVWSYKPEEGKTCYLEYLFKFDNNFYLTISSYTPYTYSDYEQHLYLIKKNQGLVKVDAPLPIKVFPTMPTREEQITVELGEGTNATEITVVNSLGQVVKRVPVEEGQRTVTIPATNFGSGLNVVNARSNKGQGSCKIIVR